MASFYLFYIIDRAVNKCYYVICLEVAMKKEDKTKITKEKIIQSAIIEFGTKSYEMASVNSICYRNKISKGLIYHNFKNKDELYLECIKRCYLDMIDKMFESQEENHNALDLLKETLNIRQNYFQSYPYYKKIFFDSTLACPEHIIEKVKILREPYEKELKKRYADIVENLNLREGVSKERAISYLCVFQDMYNNYFSMNYTKEDNFNNIILEHETKMTELLDVVFFGIVDEVKEK